MGESNDMTKEKKIKDVQERVAINFHEEIEDIKDERVKRKKDKKKRSNGKITHMIPKHKHWKKIKEDLIEYEFER